MKLAGRFLLPLITSFLMTSTASFAAPADKPSSQHSFQHSFQQEPQEFTASYKAKIGGVPFSGSGTRSLKKKGDQWQLEFGADATLVGMDESSHFQIKDGRVLPADYTYKRSGLGRKAPKEARFDWQKMEVIWQQDDKKSTVKLKPGAQDPLSYQLQLRLDLAAGKKELSYLVVDDDESYERRLLIEGEEILKTSAGNLNTIRVKVIRDDDDRQTWIWFAKDWDHVMVKLYQKEKDSDYTIEFKKGTVAGKTITGLPGNQARQ